MNEFVLGPNYICRFSPLNICFAKIINEDSVAGTSFVRLSTFIPTWAKCKFLLNIFQVS